MSELFDDDTGVKTPGGLEDWWMQTAAQDLDATAPKAVEYGSLDLKLIGDALLRMLQWEDAPPSVGAEIGAVFMAYGKIARCLSAYSEKRLPSDDSLFDLSIYSMMMRRIRASGEWP